MQILINESLKGIFVMGIDISIALHTLDIEYYSMKLPKIRAVTQWRLKSEVLEFRLWDHITLYENRHGLKPVNTVLC